METKGKGVIVNVAAESLVALYSYNTKHGNNELRYLAEEISKESIKSRLLLLLFENKMKGKLWKNCLSKKDPGFGNLGNPQPVRLQKMLEVEFTVRNVYSVDRNQGCSWHTFANSSVKDEKSGSEHTWRCYAAVFEEGAISHGMQVAYES